MVLELLPDMVLHFLNHSLMFESLWFTNGELGKFSKFFEKQDKMSLILVPTPSLVRKCKWLQCGLQGEFYETFPLFHPKRKETHSG